jgi:hypothetical protein
MDELKMTVMETLGRARPASVFCGGDSLHEAYFLCSDLALATWLRNARLVSLPKRRTTAGFKTTPSLFAVGHRQSSPNALA